MSNSIILALIWMLIANVRAMFPSKDHLWKFAYFLIAIGVPILIYVWWENGIWIALLVLLAAMSVLRWPMIYLVRWVKRMAGRA